MNQHHQILFHSNSYKIFFYLFLATFLAQIFFWLKTQNIKPDIQLISNPPSLYITKAMSLGDDEFLFRAFATKIQNSGDVFAGFVSLKNYDYKKLYEWFLLLDLLNAKSNLTPSLASYIYGQTKQTQDAAYIIKYLDKHSSVNLDEKWWWIFQAIYLSETTLQDQKLSLALAEKLNLHNSQKIPLWTKRLTASIYAKYGQSCTSFKITQDLINEINSQKYQIKLEEMNFMRYFINHNLAKLKKQGFNPQNCKF